MLVTFVRPSESVAIVLSVLRVCYQVTDCFNIVCTPFSPNQHSSMFAAGINLLAYKHRVCVGGGRGLKKMKHSIENREST